jgi:GT2 family glycosyltransferase
LNLTIKCIESIYQNTNIEHIEIIIIDNGSADNINNYLKIKKLKNLKLVKNSINKGFAYACNQAARISSKQYLIFLNNDTEVLCNWIKPLLDIADKDFRIGAVGAKLIYPDNSIQHAGVAFSSDKVHHIYRNFSPCHPAVNKQREFQAVTGACMLVPRKLFLSLGGFDEAFINGFEDLDFCFRARSKGTKVIYTPKSVVIHHESKTPGRHDHHKHNAQLFASRWLPSVVHDLDKIYAEDGLRRQLEFEGEFGGKWLEDTNANYFWIQAKSLALAGEYHKAEKFFTQALSFNPFDIRRLTIAEELSDLYVKWGRFEDARTCLNAITQVRATKRLLQKMARIATLDPEGPSEAP